MVLVTTMVTRLWLRLVFPKCEEVEGVEVFEEFVGLKDAPEHEDSAR